MDRLYIICFILFLMLLGHIMKKIELSELNKKWSFTVEYREKFINLLNEYTTNHSLNNEIYIYLTTKVNEMQIELGSDGIIANMIDPLKGVKCRQYQALVNFLPEIRAYGFWDGNTIMAERFDSSAHCCDDMFLRHIGSLEYKIKALSKIIYNPFSCLAGGIRWILWLPANILYWCGFISAGTCFKFKYNPLLKVLTFIVTMIGLAGSIITIVIGWEQFSQMLLNLLM